MPPSGRHRWPWRGVENSLGFGTLIFGCGSLLFKIFCSRSGLPEVKQWYFEFRFRVPISSFDIEFRFRVSISSFDFQTISYDLGSTWKKKKLQRLIFRQFWHMVHMSELSKYQTLQVFFVFTWNLNQNYFCLVISLITLDHIFLVWPNFGTRYRLGVNFFHIICRSSRSLWNSLISRRATFSKKCISICTVCRSSWTHDVTK